MFLIQLKFYLDPRISVFEYLQATNEIKRVNIPTKIEHFQPHSGWGFEFEVRVVSAWFESDDDFLCVRVMEWNQDDDRYDQQKISDYSFSLTKKLNLAIERQISSTFNYE